MATTDVFNNSSNNYVNPALSPCAGAGDDAFLEFLPNDIIGVVQGGNTLAGISFADLKIPVSAYNSQKKVLEPGEVAFIPGLSKGLSYRSQSFTLPLFTDNDLNPYFMVIDLSVGFYKNFGYKVYNLEASANYGNNISIDEALNIAFSDLQAKITSVYDPSDLTFTGTQLGWDFNISNAELTLIDTSENALSPFNSLGSPQIFELEEDLSKMVLYAKYPNSAMQGIILKAIYPSDAPSIYDEWIYINHAPDVVTIYEPVQVDNFIKNLQKFSIISFDPSIIFGPFAPDTSSGATYYQQDVSIYNISQFIFDCSVFTSEISGSSFKNSNIFLYSLIDGGSIIENSWINKDTYFPYGDPSTKVQILGSTINDCSISNASISDSSIFNSRFFGDVSILLTNCTIYNSVIDPILVQTVNCTIIRINETIDCSISYDLDSSIYYTPVIKTVEVGMSGCSTSTAMSAGDYLEWITTNEDWKKVGDMYIWTTAPDYDDTKNLIDGFYVFNPHDFAVQLEYLTFV